MDNGLTLNIMRLMSERYLVGNDSIGNTFARSLRRYQIWINKVCVAELEETGMHTREAFDNILADTVGRYEKALGVKAKKGRVYEDR